MRISDWSSDVCSSDLREHFLDVDHPDHLVEMFAIDRQSAGPRCGNEVDDILEGRAFVDGDDVGARHRDVVDRLLAEMEKVAQHLAFDGRQVADDAAAAALGALLLGLVDRLLDLFAQAWLAISAKQHGFERSDEHTSELQSLMRISYAVFCLKKK